MNLKSDAASYWWVPIAVLLLGAIGWLIRDWVQQRRQPGSIVTYSEKEPPIIVKVRLDNGKPEEAPTGFVRFNNVNPGKHLLEYAAKGYRVTRVGPFELKGGEEKILLFPELERLPEPATEPQNVPIKAERAVEAEPGNLWAWTAVPSGSTLNVSLDTSSTSEVVGTAQLSTQLPDGSRRETTLSSGQLQAGVGTILGAGERVILRLVIIIPGPGGRSGEVKAKIVRPDGTLHGRSYMRTISGPPNTVENMTIMVITKE